MRMHFVQKRTGLNCIVLQKREKYAERVANTPAVRYDVLKRKSATRS